MSEYEQDCMRGVSVEVILQEVLLSWKADMFKCEAALLTATDPEYRDYLTEHRDFFKSMIDQYSLPDYDQKAPEK